MSIWLSASKKLEQKWQQTKEKELINKEIKVLTDKYLIFRNELYALINEYEEQKEYRRLLNKIICIDIVHIECKQKKINIDYNKCQIITNLSHKQEMDYLLTYKINISQHNKHLYNEIIYYKKQCMMIKDINNNLLNIVFNKLKTKTCDNEDIIRLPSIITALSGGFNLNLETKLNLGNHIKYIYATYDPDYYVSYCKVIKEDGEKISIIKYTKFDLPKLVVILNDWLNYECKPEFFIEAERYTKEKLCEKVIPDLANIIYSYIKL